MNIKRKNRFGRLLSHRLILLFPLIFFPTSFPHVNCTDLLAQTNASLLNLHGKLIHIVVHSPALVANHAGDSADRRLSIYLPPNYDTTSRRYPVLYLLHGFPDTDLEWTDKGDADVPDSMDKLLSRQIIQPMIVVMPDSHNKFWGSLYTNSDLSGNWEDFVVVDVISYIDSHFRSLPDRQSRGIGGHSMGGYGALRLAFDHPDVFSAVYGMSACCEGWGQELTPTMGGVQLARKATTLEEVRQDGIFAMFALAMAAAWSPHHGEGSFGVDWPSSGENQIVQPVVDKWMSNMLLKVVDQYGKSAQHLDAIAFDAGREDPLRSIVLGSRQLDDQMTRLGIRHAYEEYDGTHDDHLAQRIETKLLPYFSRALKGQEQGSH